MLTPGYSDQTTTSGGWNYQQVINPNNSSSYNMSAKISDIDQKNAEKDEYTVMVQKQMDEQKRKRERDAVKRQIADK